MALPDDLSVHAARVHKRLRPIAVGEERYGYTVAALADALSAPSDPLNDLVRGGESRDHGDVPPLAVNLITNPSAEGDVSGWNAYSNTLTRTTAQHASGVAAFAMEAFGGDGPVLYNYASRIPVTPGLVYSASARLKAATTPRSCRVDIAWQDAGSGPLGALSAAAGASTLTATDEWTVCKVENATAPVGATHLVVQCIIPGPPAAGEVHYVDGLIVVQAATVPDYFDGDSPDSAWMGVPHASSSRMLPLVEHEPWEPAVNPAIAPPWVLRWLGAIVGAPVGRPKVGQTEEEWAEEARRIILERPHWLRGTPLYIRRTVLATLDASATLEDVRLLERTNGPWRDTLVITAARCPDQALTTKVALAEKPALRGWTVIFTDEPLVEQMTRTVGAITAQPDNLTLSDVT